MNRSALDGIRVLDLSRILAGPLTSQMLGDLGAEVIKVERPTLGDDARHYGPPFLNDDQSEAMSAFYLSSNRNKQSLTLDYSTAAGKQILLQLIERSDVLMENFRPGVLDRHGLGYQELRERFPRLVYCSVTGFGQTGPYRGRPGYDGIFQALSGMMSVSGIPDGEPGAGPMKSGLSLIDILTGLYASTAVLAALRYRDVHGEGQHLDVSLLDCGLASLSHYAETYLVSGTVPERRGNGGFGGIPSHAFRCADGKQIFIVATTNPQFQRACQAIGHPLLALRPEFSSIPGRIAHRKQLLAELNAIFTERDSTHWLTRLEAADVPVSPVNDIQAALNDEQVQEREMQIDMKHESLGWIPGLRYPVRLSASPVSSYTAPPTLGQHTHRILTEVLGLDDEQISDLADGGVI